MGSYKCISVCTRVKAWNEKSGVYILLHGKYSHLIKSSVLFAGNSGSFPCKAVIALSRAWCITSINPSQSWTRWVVRVHIPVISEESLMTFAFPHSLLLRMVEDSCPIPFKSFGSVLPNVIWPVALKIPRKWSPKWGEPVCQGLAAI